MQNYFVDLHVHIGRAADGMPVKITAARSLTVHNILEECMVRKGIDIVGIVDASSPAVQKDLQYLVDTGYLRALDGGGLRYKDSVTLILGGEVETSEKVTDESGLYRERCAHCLCYFPHLSMMRQFTREVSAPGRIKNSDLSSQKCYLSMQEVWEIVNDLGGTLIPAHAFTPHKGVYGSCVRSWREILTPEAWEAIPAIELGLSADSDYADMISELAGMSFVSNSDAHSLPKIGREYNIIRLQELTCEELLRALRREGGRAVVGNYGFDPKLGKYHRTYCEECGVTVSDDPPVMACTECGTKADGRKVVQGVLDRIYLIRDNERPVSPSHRPRYKHQIPLQNLPGVGKKTMDKLLVDHTEMAVLHMLEEAELRKLVRNQTAEMIMLARDGKLEVSAGGGGYYGRVTGKKGDSNE